MRSAQRFSVYFAITTLIYAGFPQTMSEYDVRLHLNALDYALSVFDRAIPSSERAILFKIYSITISSSKIER